jgi:hypothetical protein
VCDRRTATKPRVPACNPGAAYAVTTKADGSVEVTVRWEDITDLDRVRGALQKAGVPTAIAPRGASGWCDGSAAGRDKADHALDMVSPDGQHSLEGYVLRPKLFPAGSTLVVSASDDPVRKVHYVVLYLAPKDAPSCALSDYLNSMRYYGPTPYPSVLKGAYPGHN